MRKHGAGIPRGQSQVMRGAALAAGLLAIGAIGATAQDQPKQEPAVQPESASQDLPSDWRALLTCMARSSYINAIDFDLNVGAGTLTPRGKVDRAAFVKAHANCVRQLPRPAAGPGSSSGGAQAKAPPRKDSQ